MLKMGQVEDDNGMLRSENEVRGGGGQGRGARAVARAQQLRLQLQLPFLLCCSC
jgi:hypothetical protein